MTTNKPQAEKKAEHPKNQQPRRGENIFKLLTNFHSQKETKICQTEFKKFRKSGVLSTVQTTKLNNKNR